MTYIVCHFNRLFVYHSIIFGWRCCCCCSRSFIGCLLLRILSYESRLRWIFRQHLSFCTDSTSSSSSLVCRLTSVCMCFVYHKRFLFAFIFVAYLQKEERREKKLELNKRVKLLHQIHYFLFGRVSQIVVLIYILVRARTTKYTRTGARVCILLLHWFVNNTTISFYQAKKKNNHFCVFFDVCSVDCIQFSPRFFSSNFNWTTAITL